MTMSPDEAAAVGIGLRDLPGDAVLPYARRNDEGTFIFRKTGFKDLGE